MVEAVGLSVMLGDDVVVITSGANDIADLRIGRLTGELVSTQVEVISLTLELCILKEVCYKEMLELGELLKNVWTEAKAWSKRIKAKQENALSRYYVVLHSAQRFVKAADERLVCHANTLTQL